MQSRPSLSSLVRPLPFWLRLNLVWPRQRERKWPSLVGEAWPAWLPNDAARALSDGRAVGSLVRSAWVRAPRPRVLCVPCLPACLSLSARLEGGEDGTFCLPPLLPRPSSAPAAQSEPSSPFATRSCPCQAETAPSSSRSSSPSVAVISPLGRDFLLKHSLVCDRFASFSCPSRPSPFFHRQQLYRAAFVEPSNRWCSSLFSSSSSSQYPVPLQAPTISISTF